MFVGVAAFAPADPSAAVKAAITPIVSAMAAKYDCAVSVAVQGAPSPSPLAVSVASGLADRNTSRSVAPDDPFVWGSVTKLVTGSSVLRLVDEGKLKLTDRISPIIDPFLKRSKATDPSQVCRTDPNPMAQRSPVPHSFVPARRSVHARACRLGRTSAPSPISGDGRWSS